MENNKPLSKNAQIILKSFDDSTKLGDLRKIAKEIKKSFISNGIMVNDFI